MKRWDEFYPGRNKGDQGPSHKYWHICKYNLETETMLLDENILKVKDVILMQHRRIESCEIEMRANNVILSNIPENDVRDDDEETLTTVNQKLTFLLMSTMT